MRDPLVPPPFAIAVACDGAEHWIEVIDGELRPHPSHSETDRALHALGGKLAPCVRITDAVLRSPNSLHAYERIARETRNDPASRLMRTGVWADIAPWQSGNFLEPRVEGSEIPGVFRRVAALMIERITVSRYDAARARKYVDDQIKTYAATLLGRATALVDIELRTGSPGFELVKKPERRATISLAPDWLSTVFLFELEDAGGLTLGAEFSADGMLTQTKLVGSPRSWDLKVVKTAPPRGIRPIDGARA